MSDQPPDRRPVQPLNQPLGGSHTITTTDGRRQTWRQYGWIDDHGRMYDLYEPSPRTYQVTSYSPLWVLVENEPTPGDPEPTTGAPFGDYGLTTEQDIRADALAAASRIGRDWTVEQLINIAEELAGWIRTGNRDIATHDPDGACCDSSSTTEASDDPLPPPFGSWDRQAVEALIQERADAGDDRANDVQGLLRHFELRGRMLRRAASGKAADAH
jgi:hypothetical protein